MLCYVMLCSCFLAFFQFPYQQDFSMFQKGGGCSLSIFIKPSFESGTYTGVVLSEPLLSTCNPFQVNAFYKSGTLTDANRVLKNPPCCVFVGLTTS